MGTLALPLLVVLTTRVLLIANPASRRGARLIRRATEAVKRTGATIEVETTARSGHAAEIATARAHEFDVVLTLGGDGTAMEVAGALAWRDIPVGVLAGGHDPLRATKLLDRPAEVDRGVPADAIGGPRDRAVQRPVELEDARAEAEPRESTRGPQGECRTHDGGERLRGRVKQHRAGGHHVAYRRDRMIDLDLPTERTQFRGEGGSDGRRSSTDHRPADGVGGVQARGEVPGWERLRAEVDVEERRLVRVRADPRRVESRRRPPDGGIRPRSDGIGEQGIAAIVFSPLGLLIAVASFAGLVASAKSLQIGKAVPVIAMTFGA